MKKELTLFLILFIVLAVGMHPDFFTSPVERVMNLSTSGAYGLGAMHPLIFTVAAYVVVGLLRLIWKGFSKLFGKKEV